jgi:hypothetical protein
MGVHVYNEAGRPSIFVFIYLDALFLGLVEQHNMELEGINILIFLHVRRFMWDLCVPSAIVKKSRTQKRGAAFGCCVMMLMCLEQISYGIWSPKM